MSGDERSAAVVTPSLAGMVWRAVQRRCPRCGDRRAWFVSWFRQGPRCRGCGLVRTRNVEGHELGSLTVALVVNIGLVLLVLGVAIAITVPEVPVLTMYLVLTSTAILVPIVTWPLTHTVWMAIDLRSRPVEATEAAEARAWLQRAGADRETSVRFDNA